MIERSPVHFKSPQEYVPGEVILSAEQIDTRLTEMAQEVAEKYAPGDRLVVVGLLKGAFMVTPILAAKLHEAGLTDVEVSFMTIKSYSDGTTATSEPKIVQDMDINPHGRKVLLVDDIADTRRSLKVASNLIRDKGVESVETLVLLDKPDRQEVDFTPDYIGFTIPDIWVQGMGMDTNEGGRCDRRIITGPYVY
jgi:hypoxanthine phosphoribosyltransferase